MRSIPVDLSLFSGFTCSLLPEPRLVSQDTGEVRKDRSSGQDMYRVGVVAYRGRDSDVIEVNVVGEPGGLTLMGPLVVEGLEAVPWDVDGRNGISWRAKNIRPAGPGASGPGLGSAGRRIAPSGGEGQ